MAKPQYESLDVVVSRKTGDDIMTCNDPQCRSNVTKLTVQLDRPGKSKRKPKIRFRVDCLDCGNFSHYLPYSEINRAVERFLDSGKVPESSTVSF